MRNPILRQLRGVLAIDRLGKINLAARNRAHAFRGHAPAPAARERGGCRAVRPYQRRAARDRCGPGCRCRIAPPDHPLSGARRIAKSRIAEETFLIREHGSGTRGSFELFLGDLPGRLDRPGLEFGSNETITQAVMAGLGVGFISAHTIAMEVELGRLVILDVVDNAGPAPVVFGQPGRSRAVPHRDRVPRLRDPART